MKNAKENVNGIVMCLFEIIVGVLLLISPVGFTTGIITGVGIILLLMGLGCIVKYFKLTPWDAAESQLLLKGLLGLLTGGFCVFKSQWFVVTFPLFTMVYGVVILITGLGKVQWTVDAFRLKKKKWFLPAISAVFSIICSIVILSNPFTSTAVLWMFTGISLVVEAVFDVITLLLGNVTFGKKKSQ